MNLKLILFGLLISSVTWWECYSIDTMAVIYSKALPNVNPVDYRTVNIQLNDYNPVSKGYTVCLRFKFTTWNRKTLIESNNIILGLLDYKDGTGFYRNGATRHSFSFKDHLIISPLAWNSMCMLYNAADLLMKVTANGNLIFSATESNKVEFTLSGLRIMLGEEGFSGQIADLNIWSRPLTMDEVQEYSLNCTTDLALKSIPEFLVWSKVDIVPKNINTSMISRDKFCMDLDNVKGETVLQPISGQISSTYAAAYQRCKDLNGAMPIPKNEAELRSLKFQMTQNAVVTKCFSNYWVPVKRSIKDESKWIRDILGVTTEMEFTFEPWKKKNLTKTELPQSCLFFDLKNKEFNEAVCTKDVVCSLCQISEKRQIFRLQGLCNDQGLFDTDYFVMKDNRFESTYKFNGLNGLTNIQFDNGWKIVQTAAKNVIGLLNGIFWYPKGIQSWNLFMNCSQRVNESFSRLLKFSNVSNLQLQ